MQPQENSPRKSEGSQTRSTNAFTALLAVLIVLIVGFLFVNSNFFTIGSVIVEGNKYVTTEDIYSIAGISEPINIFRLNTTNIKDRLMHDLRVAEVSVKRNLPSTIVITIKERQPLAYVASSYGFVEVDKQGIVLAAFKSLKQVSVPMITGIRLENQYVGDSVENAAVQAVLNYLARLDEHSLNQISEVNVRTPEQIVVYTNYSAQIRLGNNQHLDQKARLTNEILQEMSAKKMQVEYIDLNYASPIIKFKQ